MALETLSDKITKFLGEYDVAFIQKSSSINFKYRKASKGIWLSLLLPLIMIFTCYYSVVSKLYGTMCILSIGQLSCSAFDIWYYGQKIDDKSIPVVPIGYIVTSTLISLLLLCLEYSGNYTRYCPDNHRQPSHVSNLFVLLGIFYSLSAAILTAVAYHNVFKTLVRTFPGSFTFGEAVLASQALILFLSSYLCKTLLYFSKKSDHCDEVATYILQAVFVSIFAVLAFCFLLPNLRSPLLLLLLLASIFLLFAAIMPFYLLNVNSLHWIFELSFGSPAAVCLIGYWLLWCIFAAYCLRKQISCTKKASTATRKSFHIAVMFVVVPGLYFRPCMTYFASGIGLSVLILIEVCRKLQLTQYSQVLQTCFDLFKDEKDGEIALTPLYLMIGCCAPIWLYPHSYSKFIPLPVLSGVLSVAVGDTAASIMGSKFGSIRWSDSSKTLEGTLACFVSQMICIYMFSMLGVTKLSDGAFIKTSVLVAIVTLVEAKTDQIDNIVLPLLTFLLFSVFL